MILMHQRVFRNVQYLVPYGQHFVFGYSSSSFLRGLMNLVVYILCIIRMVCVKLQLEVNLVNWFVHRILIMHYRLEKVK